MTRAIEDRRVLFQVTALDLVGFLFLIANMVPGLLRDVRKVCLVELVA